MALANDSITVTPGTGATVATHLVGGKEYQVVMLADAAGHVVGSRPDYLAWFLPGTNAVNRVVAELHNAHASAVVRVRGIWVVPDSAAITGAALSFALQTTTAVGTGGTAGTSTTKLDSTNAAVPTGVTTGIGRTGGGGTVAEVFRTYLFNEETNPSTQLAQFFNLLPVLGEKTIELVLRPGEGMRINTVAGAVGATGALLLFSTD